MTRNAPARRAAEAVTVEPWYRDKWPWLLMAAPGLAVFGGIAMLIVALANNDGLVADDYYKQGLAINQVLERGRTAAARGLSAHLLFSGEGNRVRVTVSGLEHPASLTLSLVHPTRADSDRRIVLTPDAAGHYEAAFAAPPAGRWGLMLEDSARTWRLSGEWHVGKDVAVRLVPEKRGG
jgi:hypothetical protein